ncbi:MAG TPA: hypothetical protein VK470_08705 [Bacteroidota bacterium]|nr:hypothetical protein [Bacteroidota bacterium]
MNQEAEELNDEIIAAITAAVVTVFKKPVSLKSVKLFEHNRGQQWLTSGRFTIMTSHTISRRNQTL